VSGGLDSLGDPALRRLFARARGSLERTGGDLSASVGVADPTDDERKAVGGLIGRYVKPGTKRISVNLAELDARVRDRAGMSLVEALPVLTGRPLRDLPGAAARKSEARAALLELARSSPLHEADWFAAWLETVGADGTLTRLLNTPGRFEQAVRVLELIDGSPILLPRLAALATGDSHALDARTPLSTLVLAALAARAGISAPRTAEERRDLWDRFEVVVDDLASRVLVLNLPAEGRGLGEWLTGAAACATPFHVTLHQLLTHPVEFPPLDVFVCENPAVLREAVEALGPSGPPLVCAEGQPSTAFHRLASRITGAGGRLHYHGDFDWPGVRIAHMMTTRHGAAPWRMRRADYLEGLALTRPGDEPASAVLLSGDPHPTPWDPSLEEAMAEHGRAVFEETVAERLIADMAKAAG